MVPDAVPIGIDQLADERPGEEVGSPSAYRSVTYYYPPGTVKYFTCIISMCAATLRARHHHIISEMERTKLRFIEISFSCKNTDCET